uniref:Uncharacterized protein n=1 Tax=Arundo donax TaxID=35708 RepID=A0A0A9CNC5_ARUDO
MDKGHPNYLFLHLSYHFILPSYLFHCSFNNLSRHLFFCFSMPCCLFSRVCMLQGGKRRNESFHAYCGGEKLSHGGNHPRDVPWRRD